MPAIKLSDKVGAEVDVELAERSALLVYLRQVQKVILGQANFSTIGGLTLDDPLVRALRTGLEFRQDLGGSTSPTELVLRAGVNGAFAAIVREPGHPSLFPRDSLAAEAVIPENACYFRTGVEAVAGVDAPAGGGGIHFGVHPGATLEIANYRRYSLGTGVTLLNALRESLGSFSMPSTVKDLDSIPVNGIISTKLTGSLRFSAAAELLTLTNPLAATRLPGPLPAVSVKAGGSVEVGASFEVSGRYEVRIHKLENGRLQVGWYRETSSELRVHATAAAGVGAGAGDRELLPLLLGAISGNPKADLEELLQSGMSDEQVAGIEAAVKAAANRNLEISLSSEIGLLRANEAAFLYEIDLALATAKSREAIDQALRGDLTALHSGELPGVTCLRSVSTRIRGRSITWNVNLLGIYNFISVAKLIRKGAVLYEPDTGALVVSDQITSEKIRSTQLNFGADTGKLRRVLAESFLITAAYKGLGSVVGSPSLSCSHSFFELRADTSSKTMLGYLRAVAALGLLAEDEMTLPPEVGAFGRTIVLLQTEYDDRLTADLFLDAEGKPLGRDFYESVGRAALLPLVEPADPDAARRLPAVDDALWAEMKIRGQANFKPLFPVVPAPVLGAIVADYSTIVWWAEAMAGAGERLAAIREFFSNNPAANAGDPVFEKLRDQLGDHLEKVATRTTEQFGEPWGLIAMHEASRRRAAARFLIASAAFTRRESRSLVRAARI
jgi:hypothetical protein